MKQKQEEWLKRLQEAVSYLNKTERITSQQELADLLGYARANVSRYLNGEPTQKFVSKFAVVFSDIFNSDYLLRGEGQLLKKPSVVEPSTSVTDADNLGIQQHLMQQVKFLQNQIIAKDKELQDRNKEIERLHGIIDYLKTLIPTGTAAVLDKKATAV